MSRHSTSSVEGRRAAAPRRRHTFVHAIFVWACCSCGADTLSGQAHTIDGSLWQSFAASVTEYGAALALAPVGDSAALGMRPSVDVWSVDHLGVAQYASTHMAANTTDVDGLLGGGQEGRPSVVAVRRLDGPTLVALQNALARFRVFAWDSTITCAMVRCGESPGQAVLEVDLNGQRKKVSWPLDADGLPQGLEQMAQTIKDASSDG